MATNRADDVCSAATARGSAQNAVAIGYRDPQRARLSKDNPWCFMNEEQKQFRFPSWVKPVLVAALLLELVLVAVALI